MDAANRYRVDTEKVQKAVSEELAAKRDKTTKVKAKQMSRKTGAWFARFRFLAER
jgi:hypothetical protein